MTYRIHQPHDFLAPPAELEVAGAPSPVALRRHLKRRLFALSPADLDAAWQIDWEVDQLVAGRLLHLLWALGVQVDAAHSAGLAVQARGWLSGTAVARALGLVPYDPLALGLSGADGLAGPERGGASQLELAASPTAVGDAAAWFLEWGRRRRRRFTVALVAPGGRLLPFDWETVGELAAPAGFGPRALTLAWVPQERVVQVPWGETADGYPVALLPPAHLMSSGVHLVTIEPDSLLGAAARRRSAPPVDPGLSAAAFQLLSGGWIPPVLADETPELSTLLRQEKPASFDDLVVLVAFAGDELRRGYFLERYRARRDPRARDDDELPPAARHVVADSRGLIVFVEDIAGLISLYAGCDPQRAYRLAVLCAGPGDRGQTELDAAWGHALDRGVAPDELRAVALAVRRWAPLALSRRAAAAPAALILELALGRVAAERG